MTPFKEYSDDEKADIVGCLKAACPRYTWTGSHFKPTNKVPKLNKGEKKQLFARAIDLSWAIPELEAKSLVPRIRRVPCLAS